MVRPVLLVPQSYLTVPLLSRQSHSFILEVMSFGWSVAAVPYFVA